MILMSGASALITKFETDLVVTFTGSTMADSNSVFFTCDLNEFLGDRRTGHGGSEQIFVLVYSACLYAWHDVVVAEIINDIFNV